MFPICSCQIAQESIRGLKDGAGGGKSDRGVVDEF